MPNSVNLHFRKFLSNINLTPNQKSDAVTKVENIARCLDGKYYQNSHNLNTALIVGSYGKGTAIRPPSDIDMVYTLPDYIFSRIDRISSNGQSQLLQEVKRVLAAAFPSTELRADGQVVQVRFVSYAVDVVPAFFDRRNEMYLICHTPNGGSWRVSNPYEEYKAIESVDIKYGNKGTDLIKMLKVWRRECNVSLKSIMIEILVCSFICQWEYRDKSITWYDWMVRDFFRFLYQYRNGTAKVPGVQEYLGLGDEWVPKCRSAFSIASKACEYEADNHGEWAESEWKKIFGYYF